VISIVWTFDPQQQLNPIFNDWPCLAQLGTEFATQWSAPHVVDLKRQVWAGVLYGARNNYISATYTHTESHAFQDAVGKAVSDICSVTPDGVLMFFPSYSLLEKLKTRWEVSGNCILYLSAKKSMLNILIFPVSWRLTFLTKASSSVAAYWALAGFE
jgi:hypothetical protein